MVVLELLLLFLLWQASGDIRGARGPEHQASPWILQGILQRCIQQACSLPKFLGKEERPNRANLCRPVEAEALH